MTPPPRQRKSSANKAGDLRNRVVWTSVFIAALFTSFFISRYVDYRRSVWEEKNAETLRLELKSFHDREDPKEPRPKRLANLTPESLLRETIHAYANAKYYSDEGRVELVCEDEATRERRVYRSPCATSFAKPNYFRIHYGSARAASDGTTMRVELDSPEFQGQRIERNAPLVVAAIREFYPDPFFAEKANLGIPPNLFITSPQLVLLFAKDPKRTFIPPGAKTKLLSPAYLRYRGEDGSASPEIALECDRLQIEANDGTRTLWIDRATKGLARVELPIEQTPSPGASLKLLSSTIDFPNQRLAEFAPSELDEFQHDASYAEIVDRFLPPGLDPSDDDSPAMRAYYEGVGRFLDVADKAEIDDVYRIASDYRDPISAPKRVYPKTFGLREMWRLNGLSSPGEVFVTPQDAKDTRINKAAYIVPCDGNALAIIDGNGKLLRKTTSAASAGEPITFVTGICYGGGKRRYAATARGTSRKLHRFDENFNDLGALDVGSSQTRFVGDALFHDVDDDGIPELLFSALDSQRSEGGRAVVYAIRSDSRKILWSNDSLFDPTRLAIYRSKDADGKFTERLAVHDKERGNVGTIALLDLASGRRVGTLRAEGTDSIRHFGFSEKMPENAVNIAALTSRPNSSSVAFVGLTPDGKEAWETSTSNYNSSTMTSISSADVNGDGYEEWIVAALDGSIFFIDAFGKTFDLFRYGAEINGAAVTRRSDGLYLLISDASGISAWRFEARRARNKLIRKEKDE